MWPIRCVAVPVGQMLLVPVSWVAPIRKMSKEKLTNSWPMKNKTAIQIPKGGTNINSGSYIVYRYVKDNQPGLETKNKQLHWPIGLNPGVFQCSVPFCSLGALITPKFTLKNFTRNYTVNQNNESFPEQQDEYPKGFPRLRSPIDYHTNYVTIRNQKVPWKNEIQRKAEPLNPDNRWKQE